MSYKRDRAWRRAQRSRALNARKNIISANPKNCAFTVHAVKPWQYFRSDNFNEKNWSNMYCRSPKLKRSAQLRQLWPHPKKEMSKLLQEI